MNKSLSTITIVLSIVLVSGCVSNTPSSTSDSEVSQNLETNTNVSDVASTTFIPPTERGENAKVGTASERQILLATSTDGVQFDYTERVLSAQANVPDFIREEDGTLRLYYITQGINGSADEHTVMALSTDEGTTWSYQYLTFNDLPLQKDPSDPDVVHLADGTYRMYYTSSLPDEAGHVTDKIGILYADSQDGVEFTYQGIAFEYPASSVIDSTTFYFQNQWHMFVYKTVGDGQLHAVSDDGETFTLSDQPDVVLPTANAGYFLANPVITDEQLRMYGFHLQQHNIRSFVSTDAEQWTADDIAIDGTSENTDGTGYIQDSSVVQLTDGTYLMAYVVEMPK